jgi:excinuclease ABC subunit B
MARFTVFPSSHYVTGRQKVLDAIEAIKVELAQQKEFFVRQMKLIEAQRIEQRTRFDLEMMTEIGFCKGIENYSRHLSGRRPGEPPPTLIDYLPRSVADVHRREPRDDSAGRRHVQGRSRAQGNLVNYGFRLPSALDNRPLRFDEFEKLLPQTISFRHARRLRADARGPGGRAAGAPDGPRRSGRSTCGRRRRRSTIFCPRSTCASSARARAGDHAHQADGEDLTDYLNEHGVKVRYLHSDIDTVERVEIIRDLRLGEFDVLVGINLLREGLDIPEVSLVGDPRRRQGRLPALPSAR